MIITSNIYVRSCTYFIISQNMEKEYCKSLENIEQASSELPLSMYNKVTTIAFVSAYKIWLHNTQISTYFWLA